MNNRLVLTIGVCASAFVAHAGPLTLLTSFESSYVTANSNEAGAFSASQDVTNYSPDYWSSAAAYRTSNSNGFSVADNDTHISQDDNSSSLFGYAQAYGSTFVANGKQGGYTGGAYNYVVFSLNSASQVSLSIKSKANAQHGVLRRGARSGSQSEGFVNVYQKIAGNFVLVNSVSNGDYLSLEQRWTAGVYAIEVGGSTNGFAVAGPVRSTAYANSYGYGVYHLNAEAVPEPASMVALIVGGAALLRRRKRA